MFGVCLGCGIPVVSYLLAESMLSFSCQLASCVYVLLLVLYPVVSPLILVDLFVWTSALLLLVSVT